MATFEIDRDAHVYRLDGRVLPSVTDACEIFEDWSGIPADVLEAARHRGTAVHELVHFDVSGTLEEENLADAWRPYLRAWRRFLEDSGFTPTESELPVYHEAIGYAGTLDLLGFLPKVRDRVLIDVKSAERVPCAVGPQTAAYAKAYEARTQRTIGRRYCLLLNPDAYQFVRLDHIGASDWALFCSALNVLKFRREKHGNGK